jgi:hypothetical protein
MKTKLGYYLNQYGARYCTVYDISSLTEEEKKELAVFITELYYTKKIISWKEKTKLLQKL